MSVSTVHNLLGKTLTISDIGTLPAVNGKTARLPTHWFPHHVYCTFVVEYSTFVDNYCYKSLYLRRSMCTEENTLSEFFPVMSMQIVSALKACK